MKLLAAIFIVAHAVVLGGSLSGPIAERWEDSNSYQRQVDALQLERQSSALQDLQQQAQATAASRALAGNAGYLGAVLIGAVALLLVVDIYRVRRQPLIKPDRYGQLPASRRVVVYHEGGHSINTTEAQHVNLGMGVQKQPAALDTHCRSLARHRATHRQHALRMASQY